VSQSAGDFQNGNRLRLIIFPAVRRQPIFVAIAGWNWYSIDIELAKPKGEALCGFGF
jgi:hypothetical protein